MRVLSRWGGSVRECHVHVGNLGVGRVGIGRAGCRGRWGAIVMAIVSVLGPVSVARGEEPASWAEQNIDDLIPLYEHLHRNPELSLQEKETAARIAAELADVGAEVTTGVGGFGVVGILRNGEGKRLLLRTDLDALPVTEQTGLEYASEVKTDDPSGDGQVGVMHACGHDLHMTNLVGVARYLAANRDAWKGTVMLVGQPAEELVAGARAMLDDGLYRRFGRPDFAVALHVTPLLPAGNVAYRGGFAMANVDSVDITVRGVGGHGAQPHTTVDPIVQAAQLVMALQTIVSREVLPTEPAVVTVGSIEGGTKHNIISDACELKLTVRSYSQEVREQILEAIERKAKGVAVACGAPEPEVTVTEGTDAVFNDRDLVERIVPVFRRVLGEERVHEAPQTMGAEDFGMFGRDGVPVMMFGLGSISPERMSRLPRPLSLHSPVYYPDPRPTLVTGITAMGAAAIDLLAPSAGD